MKKIILITFFAICFLSFSVLAADELNGSEPIDGKAFEEVIVIINKDAKIPKTYFYDSHDFSGTLYYETHYASHHDPNMIYVVYRGWVYHKNHI
ncbi:MAG: hypothetical protein SOZ22_01935 [Ezakiella sp.]|nr:hypothetical protein [Ezakiella sp.]